jgi:hypothetical protein
VARVWKWGAGTLSACAALASILSSVHGYTGAARVRWIGITPAADTATSLGDTLQLATTMTDAHGERLSGIWAGWRSTDSAVASVDSAGSVIAHAAGTTSIVVAAGDRIAQARIVVAPRPVAVRVYGEDSTLRLPEGAEHRLVARVVDARGHAIAGERVAWHSQDAAVAVLDSAFTLHAVGAGRTVVTALGADHSADLAVEIYPVPGSITLLSGDAQRAPAGQRVPQPVRAQVVSRGGRPMPGVPVRFLAADASGRVEPATDTTDAEGVAHGEWTLGATPGRQRLAVGVEGIAAATLVGAEADPVAANTRVVPLDSALSGTVGEPLDAPVGIRVTDSTGLAVADVPVAWAATGGGAIEGDGARTDSLGEAHARWRLGSRAGAQRAFVQVGGPRALPRTVLSARARPGAPAVLRVVGTPAHGGTAGAAVRPAPVLRVTDAHGNPVAGVVVALTPSAGTLTDSTPVTDASGRVAAAWTLGNQAGGQRLTAAAASLDSVVTLTVEVKAPKAKAPPKPPAKAPAKAAAPAKRTVKSRRAP